MNTNPRSFRVRPLAQLPFFCHPVYLFVAIWIVMLGTLEIQVSWSTYPDRTLGLTVFFVSVIAMLTGYAILRQSPDIPDRHPVREQFSIRTEPFRKIMWILASASLALVIYNYIAFGLPPAAGFLGFSTFDYQEYGRFKQALQPMVSALFLNSLLESSRLRRWLGAAFALGIMLAYVLRGPLLMAIAQAVILVSIRSTVPRQRIYVRAVIVLLVALGLITVIGNLRTTQQIFLDFMEIKPEFQSWPMALLWPITYVSVPISNLCWIIHGAHFTEPTLSFLYPVLPSFWAPVNPHAIPLSDSHIIDGVHTYLATYFLDFSWFGIVGVNFALGMMSGFLVNRERISRNLLVSPILLSAMGLIFFWDFFVYLPTLGQLGIQLLVQRNCVVSTRRANSVVLARARSGPLLQN